MIEDIMIARHAIIVDLARRHKEGDETVKQHKRIQSPYDEGEGPTNYFSGAGAIPCPVCKTGTLKYSRAGYNGHVHAACTNEKCVRWME